MNTQDKFISAAIALFLGIVVVASVLTIVDRSPFTETPSSVTGGGFDANNFSSMATSGVISFTSDIEILPASTAAAGRRVVNNCATSIFVNDNGDEAASLTTGFLLTSGGSLEWSGDDVYQGAIHSSSTNEVACTVHVAEWR